MNKYSGCSCVCMRVYCVCSGSVGPIVRLGKSVGFSVWRFVLPIALWCVVAICLLVLWLFIVVPFLC